MNIDLLAKELDREENIVKISDDLRKGKHVIINGLNIDGRTFFQKLVRYSPQKLMLCEEYSDGDFDILKALPDVNSYYQRDMNLFLESLAHCVRTNGLDKRNTTVECFVGNKVYLPDLLKLVHNKDTYSFAHNLMFGYHVAYSITIKEFRRFYSDTGVKCILNVDGNDIGGIIAVDSDHIGWWIIESEFENRSDIPKRCWSIGCKNGWEAIVEYVRHYFVDVLGLNIYNLQISFDRDGGLIHNFDGDISITDEALELLIKTGANL